MEYPVPDPKLTKWRDHTQNGVTYDLTHLHPIAVEYEVPAGPKKPAVTYQVDVIFSTHCFTRKPEPAEQYAREAVYADRSLGLRIFDLERYDLSKHLPAVIPTLAKRKCMRTGEGNFFTIVAKGEDGVPIEFDVFFTASKSSSKDRVNLFLQSAYRRLKRPPIPHNARIGLEVILFKAFSGQPMPR